MSTLFSFADAGVVHVAATPFGKEHAEADLQRWADESPELLNLGQPMLTLGREIETHMKFYIDNLYVDGNGDIVVAELKRGKSPRDVVAQITDYGAFAKKLTWADIDRYAQRRHGVPLDAAYASCFQRSLAQQTVIRHRLLIVAEHFEPPLLDAAAYMISHGVPLALLEFRYYLVGSERLLETAVVMGEIPAQAKVNKFSSSPSFAISGTQAGKNEWLITRIEDLLRHRYPDAEIKRGRNSISFLPSDPGMKFSDCRFRIDLYQKQASIGFYYHVEQQPRLSTAVKEKEEQEAPDRQKYRQSDSSTYPSIYCSAPMPSTGDEPAVTQLVSQAADVVDFVNPLLHHSGT